MQFTNKHVTAVHCTPSDTANMADEFELRLRRDERTPVVRRAGRYKNMGGGPAIYRFYWELLGTTHVLF